MKKLFLFLFLAFLTFLPTRNFFHEGVPYTHDGENHIVRFANYYLALKEGQFPPRLAPNLVNHYGYPVFNYNYPLANILSLPFSVLGFNYATTFKIEMVTAVFLALLAAWIFLRQKGFSEKISAFAVAVLAVTPYLLSNLLIRGNIGEVWALALFLWLFVFIDHFKTAKKFFTWQTFAFIFLLMAFFLAHNIAALFGSGIIFLYAVFVFQKNWQAWKKFLLAFFFAFAMALWFWLPALAEKSLVTLDEVGLSKDYWKHFPTLLQLFQWPIAFGYSYPASVDSMSFGIGLVQTLLLFCIICYLFWRRKLLQSQEIAFAVILFLAIFGQLSVSRFAYQLFSPLAFIQFPWRLALFLALPFLYFAAKIFSLAKKPLRWLFMFVLVLQMYQVFHFKAVDYVVREPVDYEFFSQTTSIANENRPKTFLYENISDWKPDVSIISGAGQSTVESWRGSQRQYQLSLQETSLIVEPSAYFPGWETMTKNANDANSSWQKVSYQDDQVILGRIAYQLEPGNYFVRSRFTQRTPARLLANAISAFAIILYGLFLLRFLFAKGRQKIAKS
jgi:hypothetical protein